VFYYYDITIQIGGNMEKSLKLLFSRDDFYHQRGYWVLARTFSDAGIEVILGGIQTPSEMVTTALQEDVDIIGSRMMQGDPKIFISLLFDKMKEMKIEDIPVIVGGIVPKEDEKKIKMLGVKAVFHPLTPLDSITDQVKSIGCNYVRKHKA